MAKCDICKRTFKYKEPYLVFIQDGEELINECIGCAEKYPDPNVYSNE